MTISLCSTHKDLINADLLAFVKGEKAVAALKSQHG
jgi:hypothetical protein